jgi:hypothetical protein
MCGKAIGEEDVEAAVDVIMQALGPAPFLSPEGKGGESQCAGGPWSAGAF